MYEWCKTRMLCCEKEHEMDLPFTIFPVCAILELKLMASLCE
jgi:hypothetical protein